jgi:hypothetical protein
MMDIKLYRVWTAALMSFAVLMIMSCSLGVEKLSPLFPIEAKLIQQVDLPFTPVKAVFSKTDNTVYVWEDKSSHIHLYRDGKKINTIGGLGFSESSFHKLSDIAVTFNGKLLALDSFQKKIKKFDSNGMLIDTYSLVDVNSPALFDVSRDGALYIYDSAANEVVIVDEQLNNVIYRFGKFQFTEPLQLNVNQQYVTIYDKGSNTTFLHNVYGKFEEKLSGYWQIDRHLQRYRLISGVITHQPTGRNFQLSPTPWTSFCIDSNILIAISNRQVTVSEIIYEKK